MPRLSLPPQKINKISPMPTRVRAYMKRAQQFWPVTWGATFRRPAHFFTVRRSRLSLVLRCSSLRAASRREASRINIIKQRVERGWLRNVMIIMTRTVTLFSSGYMCNRDWKSMLQEKKGFDYRVHGFLAVRRHKKRTS